MEAGAQLDSDRSSLSGHSDRFDSTSFDALSLRQACEAKAEREATLRSFEELRAAHESLEVRESDLVPGICFVLPTLYRACLLPPRFVACMPCASLVRALAGMQSHCSSEWESRPLDSPNPIAARTRSFRRSTRSSRTSSPMRSATKTSIKRSSTMSRSRLAAQIRSQDKIPR